MAGEPKKGRGRPPRSVPTLPIVMGVDPATYRMIEALACYGRFGATPPAVALFIVRTWLFENEVRLRAALDAGEALLPQIYPESDPDPDPS